MELKFFFSGMLVALINTLSNDGKIILLMSKKITCV